MPRGRSQRRWCGRASDGSGLRSGSNRQERAADHCQGDTEHGTHHVRKTSARAATPLNTAFSYAFHHICTVVCDFTSECVMKSPIVSPALAFVVQACDSPTLPVADGYEDCTAGGLMSFDVAVLDSLTGRPLASSATLTWRAGASVGTLHAAIPPYAGGEPVAIAGPIWTTRNPCHRGVRS